MEFFLDTADVDEIREIEKSIKWGQKINLRSVSDVKIHRGSALHAIFIFRFRRAAL